MRTGAEGSAHKVKERLEVSKVIPVLRGRRK